MFGELVRKKRKEKFLTQQELSERLHIDQTHISKIESEVATPSVELLVEIIKALYRDAKIRLKAVLENAGIGDLVTFGYGFLRINREIARCDYWDFQANKVKGYMGVFMPEYEWAKEYKYPMDLKMAGLK